MKASLLLCSFVFGAVSCLADTISLPGGTLTVPALSSTGASFTYNGTLTGADTLGLTESGSSCLQSGSIYCTNGAGIVTVAGTTGVGGTSSFSGFFNGAFGTWNYGSLLVEITGEGTEQIFPANAANGLGSSTPPASLTLPPTNLASLGFGNFSVVNPTITFLLADTLYSDNSGQFVLTPASQGSTVPEPSTAMLVAGMGALLLIFRRRFESGKA